MHSLLFAHQCHIGYYPTLPSWPDLFQFSKNFHIGYYPTLSWPDLFRFSRIFLCLTSHGIVTCRQSATVNPRACARALVQESFPAKPQDLFRAFPKIESMGRMEKIWLRGMRRGWAHQEITNTYGRYGQFWETETILDTWVTQVSHSCLSQCWSRVKRVSSVWYKFGEPKLDPAIWISRSDLDLEIGELVRNLRNSCNQQ